MKISTVALMLSGMAMLAACDMSGPVNQSAPEGVIADPAAALRALPDEQQLQLAFAAAYPPPDGATLQIGNDQYAFTPQRLFWMGAQAVLLSGGQTDDCHACAGTLAVHYLRADRDKFAVSGAWPKAASGTSWGAPPEAVVRTDLAANPVIQAESGGTAQGYTCRFVQLVELKPDGPAIIADHLPIAYSDASGIGKGPPEDFEGTIEPGERDRTFTLAYTGTRDERVTYRRDGAGFIPAPGSPDLPGC